MNAFLFVHFKEKPTSDGEQVYFGVSTDGFHWESINNGQPVLWSKEGEKGVRDHTIVRAKNGKFYIISTDLCLSHNFATKYEGDWRTVAKNGSKCLSMWESDDLLTWSDQKMIELGDEDYGCLWAPDVIYDHKQDDYVLHWSSSHASNNYGYMAIYYSRTKDFTHFTKPQMLCRKDDCGIIDSAIYEENGIFYRFLKSEKNPATIILQKGETLTGEHIRVEAFDEEMTKLEQGMYEAPTAYQLNDGRWCLMIDYYGVPGEGQGYIPFVADSLESGRFIRSDKSFSFPYGYKHGTVLSITMEEYNRLKNHTW